MRHSDRAYPNPVEGRLLVEGSLSSERSVSIRLVSMAGQAIELMPVTEVAAGDQVWKLSLDGIPAGMYILEVRSDRQQWREKIVVR